MAFAPTQPMLAFGRSQIPPLIPLSPPSYCAHPNVLGMSPRIQVSSPSRDCPTCPSADSRRQRPPAREGQAQDIKVDKNFHFFLDLDGIVPRYDVRTHQPTLASVRTCMRAEAARCLPGSHGSCDPFRP